VLRAALAAAVLWLALTPAPRAQTLDKTGQAEVPILEDNLDQAKTRAVREAQAQALTQVLAELLAPEWRSLYERELRRRILGRVERYIASFRTQRLETSPDRTRYVAVISAQIARPPLVDDLREMSLPILGDPKRSLRVLYPAHDPVLSRADLRQAVLDVLGARLELLNFTVSGVAAVDAAQVDLLRDPAPDNAKRADLLKRQKSDAALLLTLTAATGGGPSTLDLLLFQSSGGHRLASFDRQTSAAAPSAGNAAKLRDFIVSELAAPLANQIQPAAVQPFQAAAGAADRLHLRVVGFGSIAEEEAFEGIFFRRGGRFADFLLQRVEPDGIVYQGNYGGNRDALDRDLTGHVYGDFTVAHATWIDSLLEIEVKYKPVPGHQELELYPPERRPADVTEILKTFLERSAALEVEDPIYTEKEDNGWLDRANALAFNATIHGFLDSRGDSDMYIGEALAEGEALDIVWYRPERTNLSPALRLYDAHGRPVRVYYPHTYTRFTYKLPPGQHEFYLEVADRFGYLKADAGGYLKFHYLFKVLRKGGP